MAGGFVRTIDIWRCEQSEFENLFLAYYFQSESHYLSIIITRIKIISPHLTKRHMEVFLCDFNGFFTYVVKQMKIKDIFL